MSKKKCISKRDGSLEFALRPCHEQPTMTYNRAITRIRLSTKYIKFNSYAYLPITETTNHFIYYNMFTYKATGQLRHPGNRLTDMETLHANPGHVDIVARGIESSSNVIG